MEELTRLPVWFWLILFPVLIAQSTWLFIDARKRDSIPWFWGIWGLVHFPMPLVFYFIFVRSGWFGRGRRGRKRS
ncbi:sigmaY antisigma factor component [Paenibacillus alkaliterrae]|uniref:sigmaY antisigma factor component n=1 Tax=Paenibacillus alkaliterrae TaxID=320909 RepID=UPI001F40A1AC|nr:sigmaY antisigma factor component [Paenibacillus alkaliterrae]MCF2939069.1 sigmaY antisigma factor component [Paenibacillus alkaliterrae]